MTPENHAPQIDVKGLRDLQNRAYSLVTGERHQAQDEYERAILANADALLSSCEREAETAKERDAWKALAEELAGDCCAMGCETGCAHERLEALASAERTK